MSNKNVINGIEITDNISSDDIVKIVTLNSSNLPQDKLIKIKNLFLDIDAVPFHSENEANVTHVFNFTVGNKTTRFYRILS